MTIRQDLWVRQGETYSFVYTHLSGGSAVDLTGYTARMSVKAHFESAAEAYLSTGSDADGGTITLGGAAGTVTIAFTATESAALAGDLSTLLFVEPAKRADPIAEFTYDLELVNGATVTRALEGRLIVQREATT